MVDVKHNAGQARARPLSPHLSVYKWKMTMAMSVAHRVTGAGLYAGTILVAWWLLSAAAGPGAYDIAQAVFGSFLGRLILFGYTWALIHHMLGGLRHFIWDFGHGLGPEMRDFLAKATIACSGGLTIVVWLVGYVVRGP